MDDTERQRLQFQIQTLESLRDEYERSIMQQATTIENMIADLQRSNAELEQFAYVASHDLQAPLRTVASYTQLLQQRYQGKLDDKADKYVGYIVEGVVRMQALINDLLQFSRIRHGELDMQPLALGHVFETVRSNLESEIAEAGATLELPADLGTVQGDEIQLVRAFQNIVENAIRYRHPQRRLQLVVTVTARGDEYQIALRDNGIGFDPKYSERIFQIFQRLHTRDQYGGTGLGLAMVRKIIELHGGRVWATSEAGVGSTFFVQLKGRQ